MGAPKQKWTSEEEAALKAGIQKYGMGKWSTILKDPQFTTVLRSRSNVDLKDKWRNLNCMANGLGSRHRARVSIKSSQLTPKQEDTTASSMVVDKDEVLGVTSIAVSDEISQDVKFKKIISRMDDVILEAITKLKEPRGSSRPAIMQYVEENYSAPPELERTLAANLKILTENGRLIKVKNQYRIAPKLISFSAGEEPTLLLEYGAKKNHFQAEGSSVVLLSKAEIDAELEQMRRMSPEEAAAAAAIAVAEAEAAIAEAEAAAREAEEAEAEAEAAQCFADAAQKALNCQTMRCLNI
ncbi:telomere repeat-binding factor 2-like [Salvia hispanica]|uniref:telomere repeat-binding factor 2-like n=1 Tax=Salvia hispanica TaxID=49212 RepID=UPI002009230E|nr:telomere repeat-binding factor 2-like [Salvia hispanica]XP_047956856.1 telomere repeat-binding factor 2-like [Salvia hispanica]XP_047956857.1 telomere repeat-binding factor 2-like [Salvia hispanica]